MSSAEGTCARTRGWHGEYSGFQRYKSKTSSTDDDVSADSDTGKSERWSDLQISSTGYASEPSEKDFPTLGGFAKDLGGLKVSPEDSSGIPMEVESREVDIMEEGKDRRENMTKDRQSEKYDEQEYQKESEQVNSHPKDAKGSSGKHKDTHKRKEIEHVKGSKKNEKAKDKEAERGKKDNKRKQEEIADKKSYKKEKKAEKSQKRDRNDDNDFHRKDKHRSTSEKDYVKDSRHERDDKRSQAPDASSDDEYSPRRDRHWDLGKSYKSKSSNKSERDKDSKWAKLDTDQRATYRGRSSSRSPRSNNKRYSSSHGKDLGRSPSPRYKEKEEREWGGRDKTDKDGSNKYRRFGASGLGGYSPRRRRSDAAIKTPSPPPRSPERRKPRAWDLPPVGMDSSIVAAMAAAHQAAAQQAAALASVSSLVTVNPAVAAVSLTQATRPFRRLYVGNVPATVSDGELMEFMNAAMLSVNANHLPGTKPCINCLVNVEKNYAFAEFLTPEDATAALAFDGVTLHGTTLKIRRPKDYVPPPNGGADSASAVVGMVSSVVIDSPRKIFVGGICQTLSSDKVKEIVTAFGQLKAYHWEVITKNNKKVCFAFLEYLDPSVTLKACAGLNGMRLGNNILTVCQATPNASSEAENTTAPFYGIPEDAKTLLQTPTRVLELQNVISEEEILTMSEPELLEIAEDIRLECQRFGTVKSMHIVKPQDGAMKEFLEAAPTDEGMVKAEIGVDNQANVESQFFPLTADANGGHSALGVQVSLEGNTQYIAPQVDIASRSNEAVLHLPLNGPGDAHNVADHAIGYETMDTLETVPGTEDQYLANNRVLEGKNDVEEELRISTTQHEMQADETMLNHAYVHVVPAGSVVEGVLLDVRPKHLHDSNLGRVYVEFSREEFTCQAAHGLHGRVYGDRKVVACYFSLKLYQKKFRKGLEPQTFEEKQALALAAQERLDSYIKD